MASNRILGLGLGVAIFLLNLGPGCSDDEGFQFTPQEMKEFVAGDWSGTLTRGDQTSTETSLTLTSSGTETTRSAFCGSRSFVRPAGACMAMTSMSLVARLSTADEAYDRQTLSGQAYVYGTELKDFELELEGTHLSPRLAGRFFEGVFKGELRDGERVVGAVELRRE